jgi:hypothetical protein
MVVFVVHKAVFRARSRPAFEHGEIERDAGVALRLQDELDALD